MESFEYKKIDISQYEENLGHLLKEDKPFIVIFKGSTDPETNFNWCSDCVAADPAIQEIVVPNAKAKQIPLLIVEVGPKE